MRRLPKYFLIGAATAAHQVEGNNVKSDFWTMENIPGSMYKEPSGIADDHYNRYQEDIMLMANAGYNMYRFSIEWARIEPEEGVFSEVEIEHYRKVLESCKQNGIKPIVTFHHFSSPKWLTSKGGWKSESIVTYFERYSRRLLEDLGEYFEYICTINEANMGKHEAIANVIRYVSEHWNKEILVTENGVSTDDDKEREEYIQVALNGVLDCLEEGIPVSGYNYWSLLDNFEWQLGYAQTFGMIAVNRNTMERTPKPSFYMLGKFNMK